MKSIIDRPPRIALVGCSWFAQAAHLPALRQLSNEGLVEIAAICSRSHDSLARAQQVLGREVAAFTDIEEVLSLESVDVVDLVLPTPIMDVAILQAFQAGKHVISEKPCSATVAQCLALLRAYDQCQGNILWSVAENWPFKPTVMAVHNLLRSGVLGRVLSIDFSLQSLGWSHDENGWRASPGFRGGYILDSGVHFISMLRLIGGGIAEVAADVGWRKPGHVADRVFADLVFENQARGTFQLDFTTSESQGEVFHLVVRCDKGDLKANLVTSQIVLEQAGQQQVIAVPNDPWVQGGVYEMLRHCCASLSNGVASSCTPMHAMQDVASIEAMLQSSRLGRPVAPGALHEQLQGAGPHIKTFGHLYEFRPAHIVKATSVADVRIAIREAVSKGYKIRPIGMRNNWTGYAQTNGVSIDLTEHHQVLEIDTERKTIRAAAGARLGELTRVLAMHGLCFPSLPFLYNCTIGGAVATATHGTSPHWGTLSDSVTAMNLVTAAGQLITVSDQVSADMLRAARVSVGMLGVITEIELQAVDMKWVRNVRMDLSLAEFLELQLVIFGKYEHVWGHWIVGEERLVVQCLETSTIPAEGFVPYVNHETGSWVQTYHHAEPITLEGRGVDLSMQYGLPLDRLADAIALINSSGFAVRNSGREIELKFLKHCPTSYLGPNADGDCVLFNTYWPVEFEKVERIFEEFESIMLSLNGRPHWGKFHRVPTRAYMEKTYPGWLTFESVRQYLDPDNTFSMLIDAGL